MKTPALVLSLVLCPLAAICTAQQAIVQPYYSNGGDLNNAPPTGQTFTALDARISTIGFLLENFRTAPATITYQLFAGEGNAGSLLGVSTFQVPPQTPGGDYFDRDFSSITLTSGQTYTVTISERANDNCLISFEQWALADASPIPGMADYPGGHMILGGEPMPYDDLTFRIEPVPEPNTLVLMVLGVSLCFKYRKGLAISRSSTASHRA